MRDINLLYFLNRLKKFKRKRNNTVPTLRFEVEA